MGRNDAKRFNEGGKMDVSLLILWGLAIILIVSAYFMKGWKLPASGLLLSARMFWDIAPRIFLGFILAGMIQVMIPTEYIAGALGEGSGFKGVVIAMLAGTVTPGGPYVNFPIVASLYNSGAGVGPIAAFLTSWGLIPLNRALVYEISFLGSEFTLARYAASFLFPLLAGMLTPLILKFIKWM